MDATVFRWLGLTPGPLLFLSSRSKCTGRSTPSQGIRVLLPHLTLNKRPCWSLLCLAESRRSINICWISPIILMKRDPFVFLGHWICHLLKLPVASWSDKFIAPVYVFLTHRFQLNTCGCAYKRWPEGPIHFGKDLWSERYKSELSPHSIWHSLVAPTPRRPCVARLSPCGHTDHWRKMEFLNQLERSASMCRQL